MCASTTPERKVKITDLARMAGVSRGTVDRVLHGRGRVDPEVEKRVLALARELDYKPSRAAQQLAMQKRSIKIGFISPIDSRGFWANLLRGTGAAAAELNEYGVTVLQRNFDRYSPEDQLSMIDELVDEGINGLVLVPLDNETIRSRIEELIKSGISVLLINSELTGIDPMCYLGCNYFESGQVVGALMHNFSGGKPMRLLILHGSQLMANHRQREEGFIHELETLGSVYEIVEKADITNDPEYAYKRTCEILKEHGGINAIFTITSNVPPVCKAINELGMTGNVVHIGFSLTAATRPFLLDGSLTATIGQDAYQQGYQSLKIMFDYFSTGILPQRKRILMRNMIFIKQNCIL